MTMRTMVQLIAEREVTTRLRDRTFIISTVFLLVLVGVSVTVPLILQSRNACSSATVATVGAGPARVAEQAAELGRAACTATSGATSSPGAGISRGSDAGLPAARITLKAVPDLAAAEAAVRDGSADAAVVSAPSSSSSSAGSASSSGASSSGATVQLVGGSTVPDDVTTLIARADAAQRLGGVLAGTGVDPATVDRTLTGSAPTERLINANADQHGIAIALGLAFTTLFFLSLFLYGMGIAQSVTEEKQSRIVELLVSAVPVRALLLGKVIGNTALAVGQLVLLLAVGLAGASIAGQSAVVSVLLRSGGWFVLFFLLGFLMLASLWAAAGALAGRQEDLQSTTLPMQALLMIPFFASIYVFNPGTWMTVLSYIPFSAPLTMPRRLALGDASWWEALISAGIVVATAILVIGIGARFYRGALLRTGGKAGWREAWTATT